MCADKEEDSDTKQVVSTFFLGLICQLKSKLQKVFVFFFKLLRYSLEMSAPSIEELLEAPPHENPNIAKAVTNFVFLKFKHLRPKEWQMM